MLPPNEISRVMAKNKKKASTEIKADLDAMFSKKSKVIKKKDK